LEYKKKDLTGTKNLSAEEILFILETAKKLKEINSREIKKVPALKGKTIATVFFEASTRTKNSFEVAAKRLSADTISVTSSYSSTLKGETLLDTVHNIRSMKTDIFIIRHPLSGAAKFVADNIDTPVINAGDGTNEHPTQALLDILTIQEHKINLKGLNVAIIGDIDHSRVAKSDIWAMNKLGMNIKIFGPSTMIPANIEPFECSLASSISDAIRDADVIMMLRIQLERQSKLLLPSLREYANFFGLNNKNLSYAKKDAIIMHPGPINRGVELNSDVADSPQSVILNQVESGVAVRMAILYLLGIQKRRNK